MDQLTKATKAEKCDILALLREKDRYARCPSPRQLPFMECISAYLTYRALRETEVKPSAKINLDYQPPRHSWPSHQHRTVLEISDEEDEEEEDDD